MFKTIEKTMLKTIETTLENIESPEDVSQFDLQNYINACKQVKVRYYAGSRHAATSEDAIANMILCREYRRLQKLAKSKIKKLYPRKS